MTSAAPRLVALLGPTNTGKTHRAVERMLTHRSGMIGLPLRLLAREVYDRVSLRVGEGRVALVTGEERRIPPRPLYWVATVEAMPVEHEVDFLAVDEVQLAAHADRGHAFTDRLLHARGRLETWFLGADTMRPLMQQLVPTAEVRTNARLSLLRHAGHQRLTDLRPRSAVVAFSMAKVYELGERLRARRGGAAVVLGALSPRARNAQVALYQAGEVDYLVATDAIGMGLNLDIDHIAFAELSKFDGHERRPLEPAELAQIAGRAGRHVTDGTFGTLAPEAQLPPAVVDAIESHRLPPLRRVMWRNSDLDFTSIDSLIRSLRRGPASRALKLSRQAVDLEALLKIADVPEVRARAQGVAAVSLLWEVCRIPDYRQLLLEDHAGLLKEVFLQLTGRAERLSPDWVAAGIDRIDNPEGDIEDLLARMAFIRSWTYLTNRSTWLDDPETWQARAGAAEERLSDALHQRLMQRFVDPSAARGSRRPVRREESGATLRDASPFAVLASLRAPAAAVVRPEQWLEELIAAPHDRFAVEADGHIWADGQCLARMTRGVDPLRPEVVLVDDGALGKAARSRLLRRLVAWTRDLAAEVMGPLADPPPPALSGSARGLLHQLHGGLGTAPTAAAREQLRSLTREDRWLLASLDIALGRHHLFLRSGLKSPIVAHRRTLAAVWWSAVAVTAIAPSTVTLAVDPALDPGLYLGIGFPVVGPRAVRADILERVDAELRQAARAGPFTPSARVIGLLGCPRDEVAEVVQALGHRPLGDGRFASRDRKSGSRAPDLPRAS